MNSPCMSESKCTKRYPRPYLKETQTGEDGYLKYIRQSPENGGLTVTKRSRLAMGGLNNPLPKMFQAHINMEYCNSVKSIKYVSKYVKKGNDMNVFAITRE
ncbi:hypothetical protein J437_LFUL018039 [Ladona fulva]|uniref:Uncharacterized protein n=1 Tax=Ladona fulva TaxID=123851 RepID=A0A8K0KQH0_LADFU|nr:hypothetical protein J437_LFUL018039 [Ladona fulva]